MYPAQSSLSPSLAPRATFDGDPARPNGASWGYEDNSAHGSAVARRTRTTMVRHVYLVGPAPAGVLGLTALEERRLERVNQREPHVLQARKAYRHLREQLARDTIAIPPTANGFGLQRDQFETLPEPSPGGPMSAVRRAWIVTDNAEKHLPR
jgi:hypothetical protein